MSLGYTYMYNPSCLLVVITGTQLNVDSRWFGAPRHGGLNQYHRGSLAFSQRKRSSAIITSLPYRIDKDTKKESLVTKILSCDWRKIRCTLLKFFWKISSLWTATFNEKKLPPTVFLNFYWWNAFWFHWGKGYSSVLDKVVVFNWSCFFVCVKN